MEQIVNLIMDSGVSIIIIALFIWDWITNKKDMKKTLGTIKDSNENISKTLDLLQKSFDSQEQKIDKLLERR